MASEKVLNDRRHEQDARASFGVVQMLKFIQNQKNREMRFFLFIILTLAYGCESSHENKLIHSIQYINHDDIIDELKNDNEVLKLNYYKSTHKQKAISNIQMNYILDVDYQSAIEGNLDTSSYIELISMSDNLTIYPRGRNTFLLSIYTSNIIEDSILYDIYQCSREKKYIDSFDKKDTVDKILLFQRKEFLGR